MDGARPATPRKRGACKRCIEKGPGGRPCADGVPEGAGQAPEERRRWWARRPRGCTRRRPSELRRSCGWQRPRHRHSGASSAPPRTATNEHIVIRPLLFPSLLLLPNPLPKDQVGTRLPQGHGEVPSFAGWAPGGEGGSQDGEPGGRPSPLGEPRRGSQINPGQRTLEPPRAPPSLPPLFPPAQNPERSPQLVRPKLAALSPEQSLLGAFDVTSSSSEPGPPPLPGTPSLGGAEVSPAGTGAHTQLTRSHVFNLLSFRGQSSLSHVPDVLWQLYPVLRSPSPHPAPSPLTPVTSRASHAVCLPPGAVRPGVGVGQGPGSLRPPGHMGGAQGTGASADVPASGPGSPPLVCHCCVALHGGHRSHRWCCAG